MSFVGPNPVNFGSNLSFIAIPLNVNYTVPFLPNIYLSGGMEAAYLISAFSDILYDDNSSAHVDIHDKFEKLNIFLALGFGLSVPLHRLTLFIQPEYTRSLKSLTESAVYGSASHFESLMVYVGIKF